MSASKGAFVNQRVPYRVATAVPVTGAVMPSGNNTWEIALIRPNSPEQLIASNSNPSGWIITIATDVFSVNAPFGAGAANDYELRLKAGTVGKSARFDLVPRVLPGGFLDTWPFMVNHPDIQFSGSQVWKGGTKISDGDSGGWIGSWVGPHWNPPYTPPFHRSLQIPASATPGSDYEWRGYNFQQACSSFFEIVSGGGFTVPFNTMPNPPLGFLTDAQTFVPWMEHLAPTDATPTLGPSSVFSVDLVHGVLSVDSGADLVIQNNRGPDLVFSRLYRTTLAVGNVSSPGLPPGWTHNWDYRLIPLSPPGMPPVMAPPAGVLDDLWCSLLLGTETSLPQATWSGIQVLYPNGASEMITPDTNNGIPSGQFTEPPGAPYQVTGEPSGTVGVWNKLTIKRNGLSAEEFTKPTGDTVYRLTKATADNGKALTLTYNSGRLMTIANDQAATLLTLSYSGTLLQTATDNTANKARTYSYANGLLSKVSRLGSPSTDELTLAYQTFQDHPSLVKSATMKDPEGANQTASVTFEENTGRAHFLNDAKGNTREYNYLLGGGASVTLGGSATSESYTETCDYLGRLQSHMTPAGDITTFEYTFTDPSIITRVQQPWGAAATVSTPDSHGNPTVVTDPYGTSQVLTWEYPVTAPLGRVVSVIEKDKLGGAKPASAITYYNDNSNGGFTGHVHTVSVHGTTMATYTYTALGNVSAVTGPSLNLIFNYTTTRLGDSQGEKYGMPLSVSLGSSTNGQPDIVWFEYDTLGRVTKTYQPDGQSAAFTWNDYSQLLTATSPGGTSAYKVTNTIGVPGSSATKTTLTKSSLVSTLFEGTFDNESELESAKDGSPNKTESYSLDYNARLTALVNGNGNTVHSFTPSPMLRWFDVTMGDANGSTPITDRFSFDPNGNVVGITRSSSGNTVWHSWISREITDPTKVSAVSYTTPGIGHADITANYDPFGRVLETTASGDTAYTSSTGVQTAYDLGTTHLYVYNDDDQVTSDTITNGQRQGALSTAYQYNPDGSRQSMIVPLANAFGTNDGKDVKFTYTYDAVGRIISIDAIYRLNGNDGATAGFADYTYDANGRVVSVKTPKSATFYSYNVAGEVVELVNCSADGLVGYGDTNPYVDAQGIHHSVLSRFYNIAYNTRGQCVSMAFTVMTAQPQFSSPATYEARSASFTYDDGGRLTGETWTGGTAVTRTHTYDSGDNLTSLRGAAWTINQANDRGTASSIPGYSTVGFNTLGQVTAAHGLEYGYDSRGNIGVAYGTCVDTAITTSPLPLDQRLSYDAKGLRTYQLLSFGSSHPANHEEMYVYDGVNLVMRWAGQWSGGSANFTNAVSDLGPVANPDDFVLYLWGPTGPVLEFDSAGNSRGMLFDPHGNCLNTTTDSGFAEKPINYDSYGAPVWFVSNDISYRQRAMRQPLQYKGQYGYYADVHTGLSYCHNRYYDPLMGRWMSIDPIGLDGGTNVYAYCSGDPLNSADPSGLDDTSGSPFLPRSMRRLHGAFKESLAIVVKLGKKYVKPGDMAMMFAGIPPERTAIVALTKSVASREASQQLSSRVFSVIDWRGYPKGGPRPAGPLRLIEGGEYSEARKMADASNRLIRRTLRLEGLQIHEIHPVKFGGDPTDLYNKIFLSPEQHRQYTIFWDRIRRGIMKF